MLDTELELARDRASADAAAAADAVRTAQAQVRVVARLSRRACVTITVVTRRVQAGTAVERCNLALRFCKPLTDDSVVEEVRERCVDIEHSYVTLSQMQTQLATTKKELFFSIAAAAKLQAAYSGSNVCVLCVCCAGLSHHSLKAKRTW
jgi:hypothetical protein